MSDHSLAVLIVAALLGVCGVDLLLPLGIAGGVPYVAPVLLTMWSHSARLTIYAAAGASFLMAAGYLLASPQVQGVVYVLTNRLLAVGAVWVTAMLVVLYKRADQERRANEASARRRWEELEQIYRTAPVGLALVDKNLCFRRINDRLAEINGRPVREHIGRTIQEVIPELAPTILPLCRQVLQTGEPVKGLEVQAPTPSAPDVERHWIVNYYPVLSEAGHVHGINTVVQEITDLKRAEQALREAERVRALTAGLLRGQDDERRRISRELHDGLNQKLAALSIALGSLRHALPQAEAAGGQLRQLESHVLEIADEVRRMSHELHPAVLQYAGLGPALRSHCEAFAGQSRIQTECKVQNLPSSLGQDLTMALFRVAQEALQNVAKHSRSQRVSVSLAGTEEEICLSIRDSGVGFDIRLSHENTGLGLISIEERMRSVGGRMILESRPGGRNGAAGNRPAERRTTEPRRRSGRGPKIRI